MTDPSTDEFSALPDPRPDDVPWPDFDWPPAPDRELTGRWLQLSLFEPERDAAELFTALDHDTVWRHLRGRPADPAEYAVRLTQQQHAGMAVWVLRLTRPVAGLDVGAVVGTSSYLEVSPTDARLEIGSTAYTPAVWAGPVNPDAKRQLLGYAFDVLGAGRVQLKTDIRNIRSQRAIARLGASYEGTLRRYQRRGDDTVRDTVLFSIVAPEWPDVRQGLDDRISRWS